MSSSRGSSSQLNPFQQLEGLQANLMEARSEAARVSGGLMSRNARLSQRVNDLLQENRGLNRQVHDLLQENADMRRDQVVQLRDAISLIQNLTARVAMLKDENRTLKRRVGVPDSPPPDYQETVAGAQEVGAAVPTMETAEGGSMADPIDPQGGGTAVAGSGAVTHSGFQDGSVVRVGGGSVSAAGVATTEGARVVDGPARALRSTNHQRLRGRVISNVVNL